MIWVATTSKLPQILLTDLTKAGEDVLVDCGIKDVVSLASKSERARNILVRIMVMLVSVDANQNGSNTSFVRAPGSIFFLVQKSRSVYVKNLFRMANSAYVL
jgi:hypothetical protein